MISSAFYRTVNVSLIHFNSTLTIILLNIRFTVLPSKEIFANIVTDEYIEHHPLTPPIEAFGISFWKCFKFCLQTQT